ncbi:MAG: hypothetical protein U1D55_07320 [Phycisphaerae bacterium]
MARALRNHVPASAIRLEQYHQLEEFASKFARGAFNLLAVIGRAGVRKSRTFRNVLEASGANYCYLQGHIKPFVLYQQLFLNRDRLLIIDDADTLFADRTCVPLLKGLLETEQTKLVSWYSQAIDDAAIPRSFTTTSPVAILCNQWTTLNQNMRAVEDRGIFLHFAPSVYAVHKKIGDTAWFDDVEVYEFIGQHLHLITEPSMRYYVKGSELRRAGISDWRESVLGMFGSHVERMGIVSTLLADVSVNSEAQRVAKFVELTGQSQATYYRDRERLLEARRARSATAEL